MPSVSPESRRRQELVASEFENQDVGLGRIATLLARISRRAPTGEDELWPDHYPSSLRGVKFGSSGTVH